ncbi:unnamed protein product [Larinioides sclopetarius]|uniref:Uncharacterized protein n=1 Tax=Larinioides sclopetarius TaxID=280406 RepID=A0AAV2B202_9ARAC
MLLHQQKNNIILLIFICYFFACVRRKDATRDQSDENEDADDIGSTKFCELSYQILTSPMSFITTKSLSYGSGFLLRLLIALQDQHRLTKNSEIKKGIRCVAMLEIHGMIKRDPAFPAYPRECDVFHRPAGCRWTCVKIHYDQNSCPVRSCPIYFHEEDTWTLKERSWLAGLILEGKGL